MSPSSFSNLTDDQIRVMIERISQEVSISVTERLFVSLGIDPQNPIEAQKDMAALRELRNIYETPDFQQDLASLRSWRKNLDNVKAKSFFTALTLIVTGGATLIIYALKGKLL